MNGNIYSPFLQNNMETQNKTPNKTPKKSPKKRLTRSAAKPSKKRVKLMSPDSDISISGEIQYLRLCGIILYSDLQRRAGVADACRLHNALTCGLLFSPHVHDTNLKVKFDIQ